MPFVRKVLEIDNNVATTKFMRKKCGSQAKFVYPAKDDVCK